jgi:hypothetical protein
LCFDACSDIMYSIFTGYAGVIQVGGIRIAGCSGIYKGHNAHRGSICLCIVFIVWSISKLVMAVTWRPKWKKTGKQHGHHLWYL